MTEGKKAQGGIKDVAVGRSDIFKLPPGDIHVKEGWNSRDNDFDPTDADDLALATSISQIGVKQPLTVYWEDGKAWISDGHRRRAAALYAIETLGAEIKSVPVQTEDRYSSEADRVFSQIVRNGGKPLTPFEQGKVFKRLIDLGWSEKEIAEKSGRSKTWIASILGLQAAPEEVKTHVRDGAVSPTLAMQTLKANQGDGVKAAADLAGAVETAKAAGKTRATGKHLAPRLGLKERLKAVFEAAETETIEEDSLLGGGGKKVITFTDDQYDTLRDLLKL